jgi:chemotaxis response regulator CheB
MSIKVLLADGSDVMRSVIVQLLKKEPGIELIGAAASFAEALQLTAAWKPDVLLIDLHMRDEREYPPQFVKSQVLQSTECILAISIWTDENAKALADEFGAHVLLDKTKLYAELIPAIMQFCPNRSIARAVKPAAQKLQAAV